MIEFTQVDYKTFFLNNFWNPFKILKNLLIFNMRINKFRIYNHLKMILPANLDHTGKLIGIIWHHIIQLMFVLCVNFGHYIGVQFGQFFLHLLNLKFLAVESVCDVVWHWDHTHPKHTSEYPPTRVLDYDCPLFF